MSLFRKILLVLQSIARKIFLVFLGSLAIFCCFSLITMFLERAPKPWSDHIGSYLFIAVLLAVCLLTAIACFYLLVTNTWENYERNYNKNYEDQEFEIKPLNIKVELKKTVKSDALLDDRVANIPCEAFWIGQWYQAKIIRELKLRTGIGKQFCRIYLVEIGSPPIRQWLSADLIRQPSGERWEPEDYH